MSEVVGPAPVEEILGERGKTKIVNLLEKMEKSSFVARRQEEAR